MRIASFAILATLALAAAPAHARSNISVNFVAPQPVIYQQPVYAPAYYQPVYRRPVYYSNVVYVTGPSYDPGRHHFHDGRGYRDRWNRY